MRTALDRADAWFFDPRAIDPLILARIGFGTALFLCYLLRLPDLLTLYGPDGLAGSAWIHPYRRSGASLGIGIPALEAALPAVSEPVIYCAYVLLLISAFSFAVGFRTRWAGVLLLLSHLFFQRARLPFAYWGWSIQIQPLLLYVILSQAGRFGSVDAWLRRRRSPSSFDAEESWSASAWPLRLIQIHICTIYLVAGWNRLDDPAWIDGHAIWIAMNRAEYTRWVLDWQAFRPIFQLGTYAAWILEPAAPILLWVRGVGPWIAYALIAMHLALEVLTNVGWWNIIMIAILTAFLPPSQLRTLTRHLPGTPRARASEIRNPAPDREL